MHIKICKTIEEVNAIQKAGNVEKILNVERVGLFRKKYMVYYESKPSVWEQFLKTKYELTEAELHLEYLTQLLKEYPEMEEKLKNGIENTEQNIKNMIIKKNVLYKVCVKTKHQQLFETLDN